MDAQRKKTIANCGHKNKIMFGTQTYATGVYQMWLCSDCGTKLKGDRISELPAEEKELRKV